MRVWSRSNCASRTVRQRVVDGGLGGALLGGILVDSSRCVPAPVVFSESARGRARGLRDRAGPGPLSSCAVASLSLIW